MIYYYNVIPLTNIPLSRGSFFTYSAKSELKKGQLVEISLGQRKYHGVVFEKLLSQSVNIVPPPAKGEVRRGSQLRVKSISRIISKDPILFENQFKLAEFISKYYLSSLGLVLRLMIPKVVKARSKKVFTKTTKDKKPKLTDDQLKAFEKIKKTLGKQERKSFLLFGPTASGKTEVYLRSIQEAIKNNGQAVILVPEISLVPQNIGRFISRFSNAELSIIHSRLSDGERFEAFEKIRTGKARIVLGPRSALFAPFQKLKLIVIDEFHDMSFKQYDQNPRYDAITVAKKMSEIWRAPLILGSATPSVEIFHEAKSQEMELLILSDRIHQVKMPEVKIVDMKIEFKKRNYSVFSDLLQEELQMILDNKKQALLFINRRGTATFITCRECGFVSSCPRCDVPFTYHLYSNYNGLMCHHCGKKAEAPRFCPECKSKAIKYFGSGTEKVEQELKKIFPEARVLRMDKDTTIRKGSHEKIYQDFKKHNVDILIGTQMITKGWDIARVDLVGIVSADVGLHLPDFRASERIFQLLTQVAGRTGRKDNRGKVILQTYYPENPVINGVTDHNYLEFYNSDIKERKELFYPPYSKLIKLTFQNKDKKKALETGIDSLKSLKQAFKKEDIKAELLGPAPAFIPKAHGTYRIQIIMKFKKVFENKIKECLVNTLEPEWKIDVDPMSLL